MGDVFKKEKKNNKNVKRKVKIMSKIKKKKLAKTQYKML